MAFQEPLEADRVDHSSLFSTIVRNPIAGVVMWALGGHHDDQEHRSNEPDEERLTDEDTCGDDDSRPQMKRVSSNISGFTHSTPSMVGSELSDIGESAEPLGSSSLRLGGSHQSLSPKLSKKHLSWSDDLGKNLVLYQNKVSLMERDNYRIYPCR